MDMSWREKTHEIIFEADTPAGKLFDVVLIGSILLSVSVVMLDSVASVRSLYGPYLYALEWFFTLLFTFEYILRLLSVRNPKRYARSFFGVVDLLAIAPTYISVVLPGSQYFLTIRIFRILRIFRVLKLAHYLSEAHLLIQALKASSRKIALFLYTVMTLVTILGSLMYFVEGEENGFTSIPRSVYWAIVTLTTVGYGDISPHTVLGQALASIIMIIGYAFIVVPTGIVTAEMVQMPHQVVSTQACPECGAEAHDSDAVHCKYCGAKI